MKETVRAVHPHLETPIEISDASVQVLVIENPSEFYRTVTELNGMFEGEEGNFVFMQGDNIVSPEKYGYMVGDIFRFDLNDKKILNALYKRMEKAAYDGKTIAKYHQALSETESFFEELFSDFPFTLSYGEWQPSDLFKATGVKFEKVYDSLEEKIVCFINALIELQGCQFFVFVNLKSVLPREKLEMIYDHCRAEKVGLFLVESHRKGERLPQEKCIIITEDLCEILENYE